MKMKKKTYSSRATFSGVLLAVAGVVGASASANAQSVTYTPGDLLIAFNAFGGVGSDANFVYNLGPATAFRDNRSARQVANLGSFVAAQYGADWYTRSDLAWGFAGLRDATPVTGFASSVKVVDGDANQTIYLSRPTPGNVPGTALLPSTEVSGSMTLLSNNVIGFLNQPNQVSGAFRFQDALPGTDGLGALVAVNDFATNGWAAQNPEVGAAFQVMVGGLQSKFGQAEPLTHIDFFRMVGTNSAGSVGQVGEGVSPIPGTIRTGDYLFSFGIDSAGNLSVVPEPSHFSVLLGIAALFVVARRSRRRA
ncbi:MAG: hypothetical protein ACNA77_02325 [Opitutales bacterium]